MEREEEKRLKEQQIQIQIKFKNQLNNMLSEHIGKQMINNEPIGQRKPMEIYNVNASSSIAF